jgi:hypothetical protein
MMCIGYVKAVMRALQAAELYRGAAEAGEPGAWVSLAALTELGLGGPADRGAALRTAERRCGSTQGR